MFTVGHHLVQCCRVKAWLAAPEQVLSKSYWLCLTWLSVIPWLKRMEHDSTTRCSSTVLSHCSGRSRLEATTVLTQGLDLSTQSKKKAWRW